MMLSFISDFFYKSEFKHKFYRLQSKISQSKDSLRSQKNYEQFDAKNFSHCNDDQNTIAYSVVANSLKFYFTGFYFLVNIFFQVCQKLQSIICSCYFYKRFFEHWIFQRFFFFKPPFFLFLCFFQLSFLKFYKIVFSANHCFSSCLRIIFYYRIYYYYYYFNINMSFFIATFLQFPLIIVDVLVFLEFTFFLQNLLFCF